MLFLIFKIKHTKSTIEIEADTEEEAIEKAKTLKEDLFEENECEIMYFI